jgi:1-deoxy-D-xylulose-5-phosphate synthase
VERIGWPDRFVEHGSSVDALRAANGLAPDAIYRQVLTRWQRIDVAQASRLPQAKMLNVGVPP